MTDTTTDERLQRLHAARARLEGQLADPRTPPYSVAPLANQLRLTDKEIDRINARVQADQDGLPTTPETAGYIDFIRYSRHTRRHEARRRMGSQFLVDWDELLDSWRQAGFVLPDRSHLRDLSDQVPREEYLAALDRWIADCRAELRRCLDGKSQTRTHPEPTPGCSPGLEPPRITDSHPRKVPR